MVIVGDEMGAWRDMQSDRDRNRRPTQTEHPPPQLRTGPPVIQFRDNIGQRESEIGRHIHIDRKVNRRGYAREGVVTRV